MPEIKRIPYYRCYLNNRQGFCFKECDSSKIQAALSLDDDVFNANLNYYHGVRVARFVQMNNCFNRKSGIDDRYVIFHDDSFFIPHPNIFELSNWEPTMKEVMYIKKGDPIYSRLQHYRAEWLEKKPYPSKAVKVDDTTVVVVSESDIDYFIINFGFEDGVKFGYSRLYAYRRKFDTKEEADKMMEIFQFYGM